MSNTETRTTPDLVELRGLHRPVMVSDPDRDSGEAKVCSHCLDLVQSGADYADLGPAEWPCQTAVLLGTGTSAPDPVIAAVQALADRWSEATVSGVLSGEELPDLVTRGFAAQLHAVLLGNV